MRRNPRLAIGGLAILAALVTAIGVRQVAERREVVRLGYELSSATAELRRLEEENRQLRLETSVLTHPDRIERLALRLGLVRAAPDQVRVATHGDPTEGAGAVARVGSQAEPTP
jgi:cell division protein FtsL